MAEAIGIAILGALGTSASVATGVGIAGISIATIVGTTTLLGGSLALQLLTTPDIKQKVASQQFATRQPLPPRRRAYGRVKLSGPYVAFDTAGGAFYTAIYLVEGPIGAFEEIWLDDKQAALAVGAPTGQAGVAPWFGAVLIDTRLGTTPQAASGLLTALPYWNASSRLDGCAYLVMKAVAPPDPNKNFKKVYTSGSWPQTRAVIRGARVRNILDPAQTADPATWQWSDVAALCIRDHLTHQTWGLKVPDSLIDDASFAAKAVIDSQTVIPKNGGPIPRYYVGGAFDLTDEPMSALQGMLDASDARLFLTPAGKIGITGGVYTPPEVTLTDPRILSATIEAGNGKRASFNRLKISYVSPPHDYQQVEGDPWEDLAGQEEAGEILEQDFARPWVQNHNQLRRLAKIHAARQNPRWRISLVTDRSGLPALFEDVIRLQLTRYGIDAIFEVQRAVASGDGATCQLDLTSIDPAAWTFDPLTEEGQEPALPNAEVAEGPPDPPGGLVVGIERREVNGGLAATFLRLTCAPPDRADLSLIGRYRVAGASEWTEMARDGDNPYSLTSGVLSDGATYEAEGALVTYGGASASGYVDAAPATITATADTAPPGAPTGFVAAPNTGYYTVAFTTPNTANYGSALVYISTTTNNFADAFAFKDRFYGAAGQSFDRLDAVNPGTYYLWVRAFNRSGYGDASSTAGPITLTVS